MSIHTHGSRTPLPYAPRAVRKHLICRRGSERRRISAALPYRTTRSRREQALAPRLDSHLSRTSLVMRALPTSLVKHALIQSSRLATVTRPLIASSVKHPPIASLALSFVKRPLSAFHVTLASILARGSSRLIAPAARALIQLFFTRIAASPWRLQPG